jgi:uncharacterized membrane protein YdjX (TVP38/TMEM64 family)
MGARVALRRLRDALVSVAALKALILAALLAALWMWGRRYHVTLGGLLDAIGGLGPTRSAAAFIGLYVFVSIAPISIRDPLKIVGLLAYGPWRSVAYLAAADLVAAVVSFYLAKALGREFVERMVGPRMAWINRKLERGALANMVVLRVLPTPYRHLNFLSGVTRIGPRDFVLGTAIGASIRALYGQLLLWPFADLLRRGEGGGRLVAVAIGGMLFMAATLYGSLRLVRRVWPGWFLDAGSDVRPGAEGR